MKTATISEHGLRTPCRSANATHSGLLIAAALALTVSGCKMAAPPEVPPPTVQAMQVEKKKVPRSTTFIGQLDSPQNV